VREQGLADRIVFTGRRTDPEASIKAFDIFVLPTIETEHSSNAILEAMTCRKPVVATDVGGNREIVLDGETGLLVPPGDRDALAAALRRLAGDAELRARLGSAGRRRVEAEFGIEHVARQLTAMWRSVAPAF
jgi:glycosyltransferase involved in cell wall biosynthesis